MDGGGEREEVRRGNVRRLRRRGSRSRRREEI